MAWLVSIIVLIALAAAGFVLYGYIRTRGYKRMAERLVPPSGRFVTVKGRRLHYTERGEGPAILFVHGLGGNLHQFDIPLWDAIGEGYRLIAVDRAGSGYSEKGAAHSGRISDHADDLAALLDVLGVDRALVVGHSLGGAIALAMAVRHPDRVAGLALLSPLTKFKDEVPKGMEGLAITSPRRRALLANTFAVPAAVRMTERTLAFVFGPQTPPEGYAVAGGAIVGLRPSHFEATSRDFVAIPADLPDLEARWGEIKAPAGILYGTADRLLDHRANGEAMTGRMPGLDLELIEGVGHMPQYARPAETAAFIRRMAQRSFS